MSSIPNPSIPCLVGERSAYPDPFTRGLAYLQEVQRLSPAPDFIDWVDSPVGGGLQVGVCTWIGLHIDSINTELQDCLQACQGCYHAWQQCPVQIFAVPFRGDARLNGLCNLHSVPPTILLDVGRVVPQDWLAVVAHEYAHAQVGVPGHEQLFFKVMTHLCLGLGLSAPPAWPDDRLCHWPPVRRPLEGTDFWLGHPGSCALPVTEYYSQSKKGEGIP